ncbi:MAG: DUF4252 domain-containing protein [Bacteroidales bacterium]
MKKLAVLVTMMLVPLFAMAQTASIDKLISKYGGQEGVTVVNISPELFQIMSALDIKEVKNADVPFDKLSAVKILVVENAEVLKGANFYKEVTAGLNTSDFAEVLSVKDGAEDVRMWMKAEGKQIREFLLVVSSPDEGVVIYISGDFNMNDIEGLAQSFGGLEHLKGLENMEIN